MFRQQWGGWLLGPQTLRKLCGSFAEAFVSLIGWLAAWLAALAGLPLVSLALWLLRGSFFDSLLNRICTGWAPKPSALWPLRGLFFNPLLDRICMGWVPAGPLRGPFFDPLLDRICTGWAPKPSVVSLALWPLQGPLFEPLLDRICTGWVPAGPLRTFFRPAFGQNLYGLGP